MATTKPVALRRAAAAQDRLIAAEERAQTAARARDIALLEAQDAGATYPEIQDATGLSTSRVTQVLRRVRTTRTTP